ncbi:MAG TPA: CHAT domain-containing protein, partial [Rubrobacter sp.]|nr:CHAT domain-containing protein [Rubrobacter sp.]
MEYDDFIVGIGPCIGDGYAIQVRSPAGEGRGVFRLPFNLDELSFFTSGGWLSRQAIQRRGQKPPTRHLASGHQPLLRLSAEDLGGQLYRALFSGEVKSLFHESLGQIEKVPNRGLRIRIEIDPRDPLLARLYGLPWELLYRGETDDFLGLRRTTPLVRSVPVHRPPRPLRCSQIRVLVVTANPAGMALLQLERERRDLEAAWGRPAGVRFEILERADPESLRRTLLQGEFHILHFMGHGEFSDADGEGVLFFEAEGRAPRPVSGRALAVQLKDVKSLRLVV